MKSSKFDLSHERKMSLNFGKLVPFFTQEILPGDKLRVTPQIFMRVAPMLAPVMHRVNVKHEYWFVPYRLVWKEFQDFITGGVDGDLEPVHPFISFPNAAAPDRSYNGSLADYLGLPTYPVGQAMTNQAKISALPFKAYQLIFNENYRDPNLSDPVVFTTDSGPVAGQEYLDITALRDSCWEKDYFTSALPKAQRGEPIGAPIEPTAGTQSFLVDATTGVGIAGNVSADVNGAIGNGSAAGRIETESTLLINTLRKAARVQEWFERSARGGYRYVEQLLAQWGVISDDARLQRPEFLGSGKTPIVMSEVLSNFQFSGDAEGLPQGNMAGHGIAAGSHNGFNRRFTEHGIVIGIMRILPRTAYQQGIPRWMQRFDKFEYPWPVFANLGEQEVMSTELYHDPALPVNTPPSVFGYQERYAECKYGISSVHGDFRDTLSYWHDGRIFDNEPQLNEAFTKADPSFRIFAVEDPTIHHFYAQIHHRVSAIRRLPFFGTPRL